MATLPPLPTPDANLVDQKGRPDVVWYRWLLALSKGMNVPVGPPSSPADGDMWREGTALKIRIGGATKTVTLT